jgi:hypothetical protein
VLALPRLDDADAQLCSLAVQHKVGVALDLAWVDRHELGLVRERPQDDLLAGSTLTALADVCGHDGGSGTSIGIHRETWVRTSRPKSQIFPSEFQYAGNGLVDGSS